MRRKGRRRRRENGQPVSRCQLNGAKSQGRAYESCSEPSLSDFFARVKAVNMACQDEPAYLNLSDRGGILWGNATNVGARCQRNPIRT